MPLPKHVKDSSTAVGNDGKRVTSNTAYSGQDFTVIAYVPEGDKTILLNNLQTITTSFSNSLTPVERIGEGTPAGHVRGKKTFAGSIVFTLLSIDPLYNLMSLAQEDATDSSPAFFTVDQLPAFNLIIVGETEDLPRLKTETIPRIWKMLVGVKLQHHGESLSVDDLYTEQTYSYVCEYISPWVEREISYADLTPSKVEAQSTVDPEDEETTRTRGSSRVQNRGVRTNLGSPFNRRDTPLSRRLKVLRSSNLNKEILDDLKFVGTPESSNNSKENIDAWIPDIAGYSDFLVDSTNLV